MSSQDPVIETARVDDLRPTQMTVGFREVREKLRAWKDRAERDGPEFLDAILFRSCADPRTSFTLSTIITLPARCKTRE